MTDAQDGSLIDTLARLGDQKTVADTYATAYGIVAANCQRWQTGGYDAEHALQRITAVMLVCDQRVAQLLAAGREDTR